MWSSDASVDVQDVADNQSLPSTSRTSSNCVTPSKVAVSGPDSPSFKWHCEEGGRVENDVTTDKCVKVNNHPQEIKNDATEPNVI